MSAALSDQQLQEVQAQFTAHPEILKALQTYHDWASHLGRYQYIQKGGPPNPQQVLSQYGINFPDISDYQILVDPAGQVTFKRENWLKRNLDWIAPLATIGGGAAIGALAGGGSSAAPLAATQTVAPGAGELAAGGVGLAADAGATGAAVGADAAAEATATGLGAAGTDAGFTAADMGADYGPTVDQAFGEGFTGPIPPTGTGGGVPGILGKAKGLYDKLSPYLDPLSSVLGNASKNAQSANQFATNAALANEKNKLARDEFAAKVPGERMSQSVKASILSRVKPTSFNWAGPGSGAQGQIPSFSGGYADALNLAPETRQLGDTVLKDELASQQAGGTTGGGQDDYLAPLPQESISDKILGGGATITSILAALRKRNAGGATGAGGTPPIV